MRSVESYAAAYRDTVQKEVRDEQVLAVAVLSRPGSLANTFTFKLSGAAGLFKDRQAKSASGDLPLNVVAAVTATRVLFFDFRPKMSSIVLKGLVRTIPRAGLTVTHGAGTLADRLTFSLGDGSSFELDSNRSMGQYSRLNDGFLAEVGVLRPAGAGIR